MTTKAIGVAGIAVLLVLAASQASYGDLNSVGVLSLDWLVDSSDEVLLVRYEGSGLDGELIPSLQTALKPESDSTLGQRDLRRLRPPFVTVAAGDWLLFIRHADDGPSRVVRGVFLDRPKESFNSAAFTRDGTLIEERDHILRAVRSRIGMKRTLPKASNRFGIDKLVELAPSNGAMYLQTTSYPFGDPAPLEQYLGGMLIRVDRDWDSDHWICVAVVPVEPSDHDGLLDAVSQNERTDGESKYCHPLPCLVNFPGKKTEEILRQIARQFHLDDYRIATNVLLYFRYRLPVTDPLNLRLIGSWRLSGQRERIDVTLKQGNTFTATAWDWQPSDDGWFTRDIPRRAWVGHGRWVVRDRRLSIFRTQAFGRPNLREIFGNKAIRNANEESVVLENGPPMTRIPADSPGYAKQPPTQGELAKAKLADCPRFFRNQRLKFLGYEKALNGQSYSAEFLDQYNEKVAFVFVDRDCWTETAKQANVQPVLFHFYDDQKRANCYYELRRHSDEERRVIAILQRANPAPGFETSDALEPSARLEWLEARIRDRKPVLDQPSP